MEYIDNIVVGSGITGITIAERLASKGKNVLILEKRDHIGGNCYDYFDDEGNYVQKYGPHIFHTSDKKVWNYISKFTDWNDYTHYVLAKIGDNLVPVPFNFNSIDKVFSEEKAEKLKERLLEEFEEDEKVPILELRKTKDSLIKNLAEYVYENIFLHYTMKQWDLKPDEIDPSVTGRVPVVIGNDSRYFPNEYQGIPKYGYKKTFKKMLDNENISIKLNTEFDKNEWKYENLYYTGPIDKFFDYKYGKVKYRNVNLKLEKHNVSSYQRNSVVNYTISKAFTRISEFNKFLDRKNDSTIIAKEYPSWNEGFLSWPLQNEENKKMINKYLENAKQLDNAHFVGRLAEGKYYNMDEAIKRALEVVENEEKE